MGVRPQSKRVEYCDDADNGNMVIAEALPLTEAELARFRSLPISDASSAEAAAAQDQRGGRCGVTGATAPSVSSSRHRSRPELRRGAAAANAQTAVAQSRAPPSAASARMTQQVGAAAELLPVPGALRVDGPRQATTLQPTATATVAAEGAAIAAVEGSARARISPPASTRSV